MKKFVVAYLNNYDGNMVQKVVHANSVLEASVQFLGYEECDYATFEELSEELYNSESLISVLEI